MAFQTPFFPFGLKLKSFSRRYVMTSLKTYSLGIKTISSSFYENYLYFLYLSSLESSEWKYEQSMKKENAPLELRLKTFGDGSLWKCLPWKDGQPKLLQILKKLEHSKVIFGCDFGILHRASALCYVYFDFSKIFKTRDNLARPCFQGGNFRNESFCLVYKKDCLNWAKSWVGWTCSSKNILKV